MFLLEGACTLLHKLAMISASHGDYCTVFAFSDFSVLEGFTWQELAQLQRESLKLRHMDDMAWQFDTLGRKVQRCATASFVLT